MLKKTLLVPDRNYTNTSSGVAPRVRVSVTVAPWDDDITPKVIDMPLEPPSRRTVRSPSLEGFFDRGRSEE